LWAKKYISKTSEIILLINKLSQRNIVVQGNREKKTSLRRLKLKSFLKLKKVSILTLYFET